MGQNGWVQPIRYLIVGLVFLAIVWFISVASALINSLIVAALFAYVLSPLVNLLIRYTRLSHNAAVNITHLLFLSILIAVPAILTPFALRQIGNITPDIDAIIDQAREIIEEPIQVGELSFSLENSVSNFEQLLVDTTTFIAGNTVSTISVISTNFVWILVVLVSIYYLLKDSHLMVNSFIRLISPEYQFHARKLIQEIDMIWGRFLRGQLLLMLIVGVMSWLGVLAVGLPGAFVIGLTAGILDIIPSLGPTLAAVIAVAVAFTQGSTYLPISNVVFGLVVLLIFAFVQQIENIWIRPTLMGRHLRLHPALIFIGVFSCLTLFGILAALVVIPVMASIGVIVRYVLYRLRGIDPYPKPKPSVTAPQQTVPPSKSTVKKRPAQEKSVVPASGETPPLAKKVIQKQNK